VNNPQFQWAKTIVVCGHYGCGKTNFSLNLAKSIAESGTPVTLMDLDIVNPYFRSGEYPVLLEQWNVTLAASSYVRSGLDIPAIPAEMYAAFEQEGILIIDVGGDDAGAAALGRFNHLIAKRGYQMLYLVNRYRYLTRKPEEALALMKEIEQASRLSATHIVGNSHLKNDTTAEVLLESFPFAQEISALAEKPLLFHTVPKNVSKGLLKGKAVPNLFDVDIYVKTNWEE